MKIIVMSDSHGLVRYAEKIFELHNNADMYIHLGDGERDIDLIRQIYPDKDIRMVAGNCDYNSVLPKALVIQAGKERIYCTHGNDCGVKYGTEQLALTARLNGCTIALYGHTHCRDISYEDGLYIMNPGSCSCPRDFSKASYGIIDITDKGVLMNIADL